MRLIKLNQNVLFSGYMLCYFFINFITLDLFPLVHSDEAWLAGLSAAYIQAQSPIVTEPFFDLFPRQPHAIKWLFHFLQAVWITLFGQALMSVRLLSLSVGTGSLLLLFNYLKRHYSKTIALFLTISISLHPQILLVLRLARQEIFFVFFLICALWILDNMKTKGIYLASLIVFISIGFHPNAFIIACMLAAVILIHVFKKERPIHHLSLFFLLIGVSGAVYLVFSLYANAHFISDYWTYGQTHLVHAPVLERLINGYEYFYKLYYGLSGTYPLVMMKPTLILLFFVLVFGVITLPFKKTRMANNNFYESYFTLWAFFIGSFIIGRYNPLAMAFVIIPLYLTVATIAKELQWRQLMLCSILLTLSITSLYTTLSTFSFGDYQVYETNIRSHLSDDAIVLGNLSSGFALNKVKFYDIRNLAYLTNQSLESYLLERNINTIIYYEEYDYIHRNPVWQILYGPDDTYYEDLNDLIQKKGTLIHTFSDAHYGTRIIKYQGDYPWQVTIYEIKWH